jgi:ribosome-associated protein
VPSPPNKTPTRCNVPEDYAQSCFKGAYRRAFTITRDSRAKARLAALAAEEKKASDIVILDVSRVSWMNDGLVICSGESERQVQAIKDNIDKTFSEHGHRLYGLEGAEVGAWVLMDYDDVVVHIFKRGVRENYGLDRIWNDAERVPLRAPSKRSVQAAPSTRRAPRIPKERSLKQSG